MFAPSAASCDKRLQRLSTFGGLLACEMASNTSREDASGGEKDCKSPGEKRKGKCEYRKGRKCVSDAMSCDGDDKEGESNGDTETVVNVHVDSDLDSLINDYDFRGFGVGGENESDEERVSEEGGGAEKGVTGERGIDSDKGTP